MMRQEEAGGPGASADLMIGPGDVAADHADAFPTPSDISTWMPNDAEAHRILRHLKVRPRSQDSTFTESAGNEAAFEAALARVIALLWEQHKVMTFVSPAELQYVMRALLKDSLGNLLLPKAMMVRVCQMTR